MPAAAAEAPAGSHHVFATKKYVLTRVISQITTSKTRPIVRDLRSGFQSLPREACPKFQKRNAENSNRGEYITAFSGRKQLLASIIFCCCSFSSQNGLNLFLPAPQTRIDEFFCFE